MQLVFNELSYATAASESQAKNWYDELFNICLNLEKKFKTNLILLHSQSPKDYFIYPNYPFIKWIKTLQKDDRSRVLSMLTNAPFIHDYPYYSVKITKKEGKGIGYAYENEEVLISFASEDQWRVSSLVVIMESLSDTGDFIDEEELSIRHCYDSTSTEAHQMFLESKLKKKRENIRKSVSSGVDLWCRKTELFPNLLFCSENQTFIESVSGTYLANLVGRLGDYEEYFSNWTTGDFDISAVTGNARLESETRQTKFNRNLTIICPDGQRRFFNLHCNYGVWGYRIHFFPDSVTRKCIIGYIGKKIGT